MAGLPLLPLVIFTPPSYRAAAPMGTCALRKERTQLIVRSFSSGGSRHGKTAISELGANEATSTRSAAVRPRVVRQDPDRRTAIADEIARYAVEKVGLHPVEVVQILVDLRHVEVGPARQQLGAQTSLPERYMTSGVVPPG